MKFSPRTVKFIGWPALFIAGYVFFLYRLFPYDNLVDLMTRDLRGYQIEIGSISAHLLPGFTASQVVVRKTEEGLDKPWLTAEEVSISLKLLPLLLGRVGFNFEARIFEGELEGSCRLGSGNEQIDLQADKLKMELFGPLFLPDALPPIGGTVNVRGGVSLGPQGWSQASGGLEFELNGLRTQSTEKILGVVPNLSAGNLKGKIKIERGQLASQNVASTNGDLLIAEVDLQSTLKSRLAHGTRPRLKPGDAKGKADSAAENAPLFDLASLGASSLRAKIKFKFSDSFMEKNPGFFQDKPGDNLAENMIFEQVRSQLRKAGKPDGFYTYQIYGTLGHPRFRAGS